ncbi:MAG: class I SAM-dependent methyltransferase, partial [Candidatus Hodarchaeales archaeon]
MDLNVYTGIQSSLKLENDSVIQKNLDWFGKEAENRDQIVYNYFGNDTFSYLVNLISDKIQSNLEKSTINILDTGIGAGTFSVPIYQNLASSNYKEINYFGLDISLKMLQVLKNKTDNIFPLIGRLENIKQSLDLHKKVFHDIPIKFDVILATLVIHHIPDIDQTFKSISEVLDKNGTFIVLDMLEHPPDPEEPEAHPGFELNNLNNLAKPYFERRNLIE